LTDQEFEQFSAGDENSLSEFYCAHYSYVTGWLIYKEKCPQGHASEFYNDAVFRVRDMSVQGKLKPGNLRAYLLLTAINLWKMEIRGGTSLLKRHEKYLEQLPDNYNELDFDTLIRSEEDANLEINQQRTTLAIQRAMEQLSDACRKLLTDTIVNGKKVGGLVEEYGLKNALGVTAKKQDCKKQLRRLVEQIINQNGWKLSF
jgi:DNA-directed RNA polymerase specialized sigma24 family protein